MVTYVPILALICGDILFNVCSIVIMLYITAGPQTQAE